MKTVCSPVSKDLEDCLKSKSTNIQSLADYLLTANDFVKGRTVQLLNDHC